MQELSDNIVSILKEVTADFYIEEEKPLKNVLLVGVQHMLGTTADMLEVMRDFGLQEALIGGKHYSTNEESVQRTKKLGFEYISSYPQLRYGGFCGHMQWVTHTIWTKALEKMRSRQFDLLIILDDGADLLLSTPGILFLDSMQNKPRAIVGIEQTNGGANTTGFKGLPFPIINVAGTYVKKRIEYPHLAKMIANRIIRLLTIEIRSKLSKTPIIGVLGYGNMGQAITEEFSKNGFPVIIYEKELNKRIGKEGVHYSQLEKVLAEADVIIGCTGKNVIDLDLGLPILLNSTKNKWLISTGSKDLEFYNLLAYIQDDTKKPQQIPNSLATIKYKNKKGATLEIIRGGFPFNFDNTKHSLSPDKIWTTRAALLLATLFTSSLHYKAQIIRNSAAVWSLPARFQAAIIRKYLQLNPNDNYIQDLKQNDAKLINFIIDNSIGKFIQPKSEIVSEKVLEEALIL